MESILGNRWMELAAGGNWSHDLEDIVVFIPQTKKTEPSGENKHFKLYKENMLPIWSNLSFQPLWGVWEKELERWHTWIKTLQSQKIQS